MKYFVYILRNNKGKLYIGQTTDMLARLRRHNKHQGAKYTAQNKNFILVYHETYSDLKTAMRREKQLKGWTRAKKEALIAQDFELLKKL